MALRCKGREQSGCAYAALVFYVKPAGDTIGSNQLLRNGELALASQKSATRYTRRDSSFVGQT
jgi:hypothetical protein